MLARKTRSCPGKPALAGVTAGLLLTLAAVIAEPDVDAAATRDWQVRRNDSLRHVDGWLALVGLFRLREGESDMGSAPGSDIQLAPPAPARVGNLTVSAQGVHFQAASAVEVTADGKPITHLDLRSDASTDGPTRLELGSLSWWLIERVGCRWLRISDKQNPALADPEPMEYFPIGSDWRVPARLHKTPSAPELAVPTVLGLPSLQAAAGVLQFARSGQKFSLQALAGTNGSLFVIFADATNGSTTYDAGRFLWVDGPDSAGHTILDFNRAYNPPCAFTAFATCPLPPPGNRLRIAVTAGEKRWTGTVH